MRKINSTQKANQELIIRRLSHDGRGIADCEGKIVFVSGALPNERVRIEFTARHARFDEAITREILEPSPLRQTPLCPHFGVCGGCRLQHYPTEAVLEHKLQSLLALLQHQGGAHPKEILPTLVGKPYGYRRKARLGVRYDAKENKMMLGFREKNSKQLTNLTRCEVLHPAIGQHITSIAEKLMGLEQKSAITQIEVAVDEHEAALVIRHTQTLSLHDMTQLKTLGQSLALKIYLKGNEERSPRLLYPDDANVLMTYELPKYDLSLSYLPDQFTQINAEINHQMINSALTLLELNNTDEVLDLFCGVGNFSLPMAKYARSVVGIEGDLGATTRATENAKMNQLANTEFYAQNLFLESYQGAWSQRRYAKLLMDPPRAGAKEIVQHLRRFAPSIIVYVSCNPFTLARDTKALLQQGYTLDRLQMIDMFPQTEHTEAMVRFKRKK